MLQPSTEAPTQALPFSPVSSPLHTSSSPVLAVSPAVESWKDITGASQRVARLAPELAGTVGKELADRLLSNAGAFLANAMGLDVKDGLKMIAATEAATARIDKKRREEQRRRSAASTPTPTPTPSTPSHPLVCPYGHSQPLPTAAV